MVSRFDRRSVLLGGAAAVAGVAGAGALGMGLDGIAGATTNVLMRFMEDIEDDANGSEPKTRTIEPAAASTDVKKRSLSEATADARWTTAGVSTTAHLTSGDSGVAHL